MTNTKNLIAIAMILALATTAGAQIAHDYPGGGDLGYHDWTQPMAQPLALTDTTVVLPVQGVHAHPDRLAAGLQVLRHLHGIVLVDFVPIPGGLADLEGIWHAPYRLDDRSLVMPGPGADGVYGTNDDVLVYVTGLDEPAVATVSAIPLNTHGPRRFEELVVAGPHRVFYYQGEVDGYSFTGDQNLVVIDQIGQPGQNVAMHYVPQSDGEGAAPIFLKLDTGWLMPMTGRDGAFTTPDDEFGLLTFAANGNPTIVPYALGHSIFLPTDQPWPARIGPDSFMFASLGGEGGTFDDVLVRVQDLTTSQVIRTQGVGGELYFTGLGYNPRVEIDDNGTFVAPRPGADAVWGTDDDVVAVLDGAAIESLPAYAALQPNGGGAVCDPVALGSDVTLVPHYGSAVFGYTDPGIVVIAPNATGPGHVSTTLLLFEEVKHIIPMSESSAMIFTAAGSSYYFTGFGGNQIVQYQVSAGGWDGISTPVRLSPSAVATTVAGIPDPNFLVADTLRLHKVAATWSYGQETTNAGGYTLDIGVGANAPLLGGAPYQVTLSNAPANEPAVLLVSLGRDHLEVMPGAFLLVEPESVLHLFNWGTFATGDTAISLLPPSNPLFQGIAGHFQWLVWDAAAPRGFQLSKGLTISF